MKVIVVVVDEIVVVVSFVGVVVCDFVACVVSGEVAVVYIVVVCPCYRRCCRVLLLSSSLSSLLCIVRVVACWGGFVMGGSLCMR